MKKTLFAVMIALLACFALLVSCSDEETDDGNNGVTAEGTDKLTAVTEKDDVTTDRIESEKTTEDEEAGGNTDSESNEQVTEADSKADDTSDDESETKAETEKATEAEKVTEPEKTTESETENVAEKDTENDTENDTETDGFTEDDTDEDNGDWNLGEADPI